MIRTLTESTTAPGEQHIVLGGLATWQGAQPKGVIWCHGSGEDASTSYLNGYRLVTELAKRSTVHVGDLGFQTWGNDTVVTRIDEAIDHLEATYGVTTPVVLVGISMGGCSALNYALRNPDKVAGVAAVIPLVDLDNSRNNAALSYRWPEIDAIYGTPPADYSEHSPVEFAAQLDPEMPIHVWSSSDDTLAPQSTHEAFVAARPQTGFSDIGAVGHTFPTTNIDAVLEFIRPLLREAVA